MIDPSISRVARFLCRGRGVAGTNPADAIHSTLKYGSARSPDASVAEGRARRPCRSSHDATAGMRHDRTIAQTRRLSEAAEQNMQRRDFIKASGLGLGALAIPAWGRAIAAEELVSKLDVGLKKRLADTAMTAAKGDGATYCDVRIGRYLRQFVITREDKVQNVVNTESTGVGIRVIANGTWGFAATSDLSADAVAKAARQAVQIAKANVETDHRAGPAGTDPGCRRSVLGDADRQERDGGADQGKGRPAARRQCGRDRRPAPASSIRPCSRSTSRSTSPRPTAPTSTRTSIASGRRFR